ncbi:hypothetical protein Sjap_003710 [Stephania japonica]|uniref:VQ domain-containing protein n=1 Tax=Stephania japonica TaxID=461633 RepID=A0AAP0KQA7_9MAGN
MAMSDTMSSSTDWAQLYQLNNLDGSSAAAPQHDATVVTTTVSTSTMAPAALSPEGRVSKPPRRRRASRAAPTTLLNTDTTNFRAMVQQFTGVPSAAFTFGTSTTTHHGQMSGPSLSFGLAQQQQQQQQHMNVGVGPRHQQSGYSNYIANNRYQQQQPRFYSQQQQQYVFPFNSGGGENIVGYGMSDGGTTSARANNMEMSSDGYVMDHGGHLFHHGSSPSSDGNRTSNSHHGYNL